MYLGHYLHELVPVQHQVLVEYIFLKYSYTYVYTAALIFYYYYYYYYY
jgi:hypothetical protein